MSHVHVIHHPLVQDRLTLLRRQETDIGSFRRAMSDLGYLLFYEACSNLPMEEVNIQTPLMPHKAHSIRSNIVLVAVLRAGLGFLDGVLDHVPIARVGYLGLKRDPTTLQALSYYKNIPKMTPDDTVFVLDPMLATGHTAVAALKELVADGAKHLHLISLLASPKGLEVVQEAIPGIHITTAAIDPILNEKGYILPGLGDAGDRLYGTLDPH